jgi:uncharacterized protein (DUF2235 family)
MKRIVICADGTWNLRDQVDETSGKRRPTNVTKMARAVLPAAPDGVAQVVYYHSGVGTGGKMDALTGGAFGQGIEDNIRDLYRFILYNYVEGDELYFFGFSRGAFTVRSLAGFMSRYGLVRKHDDYYVPEMYRCYAEGIEKGSDGWQKVFVRADGSERIQEVRGCPPIHFLGVWDTVGALGAPGLLGRLFKRDDHHRHHHTELNNNIRTAVHALAIDEQRALFAATLFEKPDNWPGELHQCWFAGVHSNVGGSYDPDGLANVPLHWMARHAQRAGLALDGDYLHYFTPEPYSTLNDSMSAMYRAMGGPMPRSIGGAPSLCETVHDSVLKRMAGPAANPAVDASRYAQPDPSAYPNCPYAPANLPALKNGRVGDMPVVGMPELPGEVAGIKPSAPQA